MEQDHEQQNGAIVIPDNTPAPEDRKPDLDEEPVARRPGKLTTGQATKIGVNAFAVKKIPNYIIHHYDVQIQPLRKAQSTRRESDKDLPPEVSRKVVDYMFKRAQMFGDIEVGFDGKRNLYAPDRLAKGDEGKSFETETMEIQLPDDEEPEVNGHTNGRNGHSNGTTNGDSKARTQGFTVRMKHVGVIDTSDLRRFLDGDVSATEGIQLSLMALNVLINTMPAGTYPSKKTSFFPPDIQADSTAQHNASNRGGRGGGRGGRGGGRGGFQGGGGAPQSTESGAFALSKGIEVWRGYFTSLRPTLGKLIVNVDITHQPFVSAGSMIQVALAIIGGRDPRNLVNEMNDRRRGWVELERVLRGSQIKARYGHGESSVHRRKIKELGKVGADKQIFEYNNGNRLSVAEYWKQTYGMPLKYPELPCIRVSATAWYPFEVCDLMSGNKYNRTLSPDQVAQAIKFTTVKPRERMAFIKKIKFLSPTTNPALQAWGMEFEDQPMDIPATILNAPTIKLKNARRNVDQTTQPSEGQWSMTRPDALGFFRPAVLNHWAVVVFKDERNSFFARREAQQSISELCRAMSQAGMEITNTAPEIHFTGNDEFNDVARIFKEVGKAHFQRHNAVPQLIVCYLAKQNCPDYAQIKRFGDVEHGVATQCMSIEKVKTKGNGIYYANVALKINPKLAGVNQILDAGALQGFDDVPSMIFGADCTHPPPDSREPSVSALVGSMDRYAASYGTTTRIQSSRQESIEHLEEMCFDLLKMFEQKNKRKPQRIIVYRDGVSEGQFQIVLRKEVSAFRAALRRFSDGGPEIKITYIVAAKRHHFRFFPNSDRDAERSGNVKAGTCIDSEITDPTSWDWYLQSHGGLLGTSRSSHYTVLLDENNFTADKLTSLSYNLCYLYARSTRSVSIVTPCYYAHHACVRAKLLAQPTNEDAQSSFSNASRGSQESAERARQLDQFKNNLKPLHSKIHDTLYFL